MSVRYTRDSSYPPCGKPRQTNGNLCSYQYNDDPFQAMALFIVQHLYINVFNHNYGRWFRLDTSVIWMSMSNEFIHTSEFKVDEAQPTKKRVLSFINSTLLSRSLKRCIISKSRRSALQLMYTTNTYNNKTTKKDIIWNSNRYLFVFVFVYVYT